MDWDEIMAEAQQRTNEEGQPADEIDPAVKALGEVIRPYLRQIIVQFSASLFKAGALKEGKVDLIQQAMQKLFSRKLAELPPEAKAALAKTTVTVMRLPDRIEIVADGDEDPDVEKVKGILLDSMLPSLARIIAFFGCRVDVMPQSDD